MINLKKSALIIICLAFFAFVLSALDSQAGREKEVPRLLYFKQKVWEFAQKYRDQDVIVVSKKDHLLYYYRNGKLVRNDKWNGFIYNFPVKVSLANKYHRTPEGETYVDGKNNRSRYTLFLSLSNPGAYGIHGAATSVSRYLDRMEKKDPNFTFVTKKDDTRGCVAVENRVIKYLFSKIDLKTPVLIIPD
ncbi:MAG: L,D-transpeptidase [Candidatus Margulisbacteria bacterium]|nr:L,D-transpeptidase [Candidatus Margulisiibacteriota bacterium]